MASKINWKSAPIAYAAPAAIPDIPTKAQKSKVRIFKVLIRHSQRCWITSKASEKWWSVNVPPLRRTKSPDCHHSWVVNLLFFNSYENLFFEMTIRRRKFPIKEIFEENKVISGWSQSCWGRIQWWLPMWKVFLLLKQLQWWREYQILQQYYGHPWWKHR